MIYYQTDVLQDRSRTGKVKFWQGFVEYQGDRAYTYTEYWQEGSATQRSAFTEVHPKNVGRKNATTAVEQAVLEVKSAEATQRKRGYVAKGEVSKVRLLPMLAHPYEARKRSIQWPAYAQPKLDGVRALYDGREFWSRKGEQFKEECIGHLHFPLLDGVVLDGELMLPAPYGFQDITAFSKKARPEQHLLEFHVFDAYLAETPDMPFGSRLSRLKAFRARTDVPAQVKVVETRLVSSEHEMLRFHANAVAAGYEGTMVRNVQSPYTPKYRSPDLLKHKDFQEEDYLIVGFKDGDGKDQGAIKFVCQTPAGRTFEVVPNGSYEKRKQDFLEGPTFVGRWLKVEFQNLTDDGIPRFPRGLGVREDR